MNRVLLAVLLAASSHAPVSVGDLEAEPETWDGREVVLTGEIVGDYSERSDVAWVQVNDDDYVATPLAERSGPSGTNAGIGVRMPIDVFDGGWGPAGGYGIRGPVVEVRGVFRYNSADDQGETFIDADSVMLLEPSRPVAQDAASLPRAVGGVALTLAGLWLWWTGRRRRAPTGA